MDEGRAADAARLSYGQPTAKPALCLPRAIRGGDDSLARDSFLTRMKSSSVNRTNDIAKACR